MPKLAEWFVEISTKGKEQTNKDIDGVKGKLSSAASSAGSFLKSTASALSTIGIVGTAAAVAGLHGSNEWNRFMGVMDKLAQRLGSLLLPIIERVGDGLEAFLAGSDERFGKMAAAIERIAESLLPVFLDNLENIGVILDKLVIPALVKMAELFEKMEKSGFLTMMNKLMPGTGSIGEMAKNLPQLDTGPAAALRLPSRPGQFESVESGFKRIQVAAVNLGPSAAERTAKAAETIAAKLNNLAGNVNRKAMEADPLGA